MHAAEPAGSPGFAACLVEIQLVVVELVKHLGDTQVSLKSQSKVGDCFFVVLVTKCLSVLSQIAFCALNQEPDRLHDVQVLESIWAFVVLGERRDGIDGLVDVVCTQIIFGGFGVDESVLQVEFQTFVHHRGSLVQLVQSLEDTGFHDVQLDQCWGVANGHVYLFQGSRVFPHMVVVLGKEVCCPAVGEWLVLSVVEEIRNDRVNGGSVGLALVQRLHIDKRGWNTPFELSHDHHSCFFDPVEIFQSCLVIAGLRNDLVPVKQTFGVLKVVRFLQLVADQIFNAAKNFFSVHQVSVQMMCHSRSGPVGTVTRLVFQVPESRLWQILVVSDLTLHGAQITQNVLVGGTVVHGSLIPFGRLLVFQSVERTFGKHRERDLFLDTKLLQSRRKSLRDLAQVWQGELIEISRTQLSTPTLENLQHLSTSLDLQGQELHSHVGGHLQKLVGLLRVLEQPLLDKSVDLGSSSFNHVAHQSPWGSAEPKQRNTAIQLVSRGGYGIECPRQFL
ncbi:hypothetical protein OGAPHI_006221 [Ogataea philodendri]|uniref:Uncharacterized protein n=1 Tax=Ogataea philodendri TaxID=1378263 RepID=A0A9P8NYE0_9ASCO|nr:uncharacterized protein OGAPHI_006221 [Ogataea philodendri]KAH3662040.1 hypothetical protein OGAPHI_006221 [Ogataea philodendri]